MVWILVLVYRRDILNNVTVTSHKSRHESSVHFTGDRMFHSSIPCIEGVRRPHGAMAVDIDPRITPRPSFGRYFRTP